MPNAILRAGPFASSSDSFLNQPDEPSALIDPVNCANNTSSSNWPWRYNDIVGKNLTTHTGCESTPGGDVPVTSVSNTNTVLTKTVTGNFSINSSASSNRLTQLAISLSFKYQAAQSFNIKVTFSGTASVSGGAVFTDDISFEDSQTTSPITSSGSINSSVTRTLSAAVLPTQYFATLAVVSGLDFPSDICTPNSESANSVATLTFEFL